MEKFTIRSLHIDNTMLEWGARRTDELIQRAIEKFHQNSRSVNTNNPLNPNEPLKLAFYDHKYDRSFVNDLACGHEIIMTEPCHIVVCCANSGPVNSIEDIERSPGYRLLRSIPREHTEVLLYTNGYHLIELLGDQDIIASEIHGFFMQSPASGEEAQEKFVQRVTRMLQNVLKKIRKNRTFKRNVKTRNGGR